MGVGRGGSSSWGGTRVSIRLLWEGRLVYQLP